MTDQVAFRRGLIFGLTMAETFLLLVFIFILAFAAILAREAERAREAEDPPIVTLSEADGFSFATGSAELTPAFEARLRDEIAPKLLVMGSRYNAFVVEVVGHTDSIPMRGDTGLGGSNLDQKLAPWLLRETNAAPVAGDNVGLGMARAVAVARVLRNDALAENFTVVPLSAGPFLHPNDTMQVGTEATSDARRRRIEIRLRRRR